MSCLEPCYCCSVVVVLFVMLWGATVVVVGAKVVVLAKHMETLCKYSLV